MLHSKLTKQWTRTQMKVRQIYSKTESWRRELRFVRFSNNWCCKYWYKLNPQWEEKLIFLKVIFVEKQLKHKYSKTRSIEKQDKKQEALIFKKILLFINGYIIRKFQKETRRSWNVNIWPWIYLKLILMFHLHVSSMPKYIKQLLSRKLDLA